MEGTDIKALEQKLAEAIAERDKLREENKKLLSELEGPTPRHKFSNRSTVKSLRGRDDEGVGVVGSVVTVAGWVKNLRVQGGGRFAFIELNDGSTILNLQIFVDKTCQGFEELAKKGGIGASVWVRGQIVESKGKGQKIELRASAVEILGESDPSKYPLASGQHKKEYLRSIAHLRPRTNTFGAIARVRNALAYATHLFFQQRGFLYVHTPLITGSDCEGAGEMFQVTTLLLKSNKTTDIPTVTDAPQVIDYSQDFFGRPAYLTVSGQLNGEIYASSMTNVYTFGPTFRAEDSHTKRHLAEFWMIEPEMAFADIEDNMSTAEAYLKFAVRFALDTCKEDMAFFDKESKEPGLLQRLNQVVSVPFKRITYTEGVEILQKEIAEGKAKFSVPVTWGMDLKSEHERYLAEVVFKQPIIVTGYPRDIKAFYMRANDDGKTVAAMDVLVPRIGEIIGGSQREERLDKLLARIEELKLDEKAYSWYLDLRRFGSVPHSGFGLGFERMVLFVTGVQNIRDAIPFPRYPKHAEF